MSTTPATPILQTKSSAKPGARASKSKTPAKKNAAKHTRSGSATANAHAKVIALYKEGKTTAEIAAKVFPEAKNEKDQAKAIKSVGWHIWAARKEGKVGYRNELSAKAKKSIGGDGRVA